jgi:hypothetical protein
MSILLGRNASIVSPFHPTTLGPFESSPVETESLLVPVDRRSWSDGVVLLFPDADAGDLIQTLAPRMLFFIIDPAVKGMIGEFGLEMTYGHEEVFFNKMWRDPVISGKSRCPNSNIGVRIHTQIIRARNM